MSPQPEDDLQRRLQELEQQINAHSSTPEQNSPSQWLDWQANYRKLQHWFNSLPRVNKLIVVGVTAVLGLAIAQMVLKLFISVISLALLAGLVYLVYKKFISSNSQNQQ